MRERGGTRKENSEIMNRQADRDGAEREKDI